MFVDVAGGMVAGGGPAVASLVSSGAAWVAAALSLVVAAAATSLALASFRHRATHGRLTRRPSGPRRLQLVPEGR